MKLTDLALVFVGIILPIIIVVFVNISFTIKATEQEVYYHNLVDLALKDASTKMKQIENDDQEIDYGYSGLIEGKVSINAKIAVDGFFESLTNNLNLNDNERTELFLKYYVPAVIVVDYNGVYVASMEEYEKDGKFIFDYALKPKMYFTFTYAISGNNIIVNLDDIETLKNSGSNNYSIHYIEFTTSDYVVHRGYRKTSSGKKEYDVKGFYITDRQLSVTESLPNNNDLYDGKNNGTLKDNIEALLLENRKEVIVGTVINQLDYYINKHNMYARSVGINYNFSFDPNISSDMYEYVDDVGIMSFVQGISMGNKYLNYNAYSAADINTITKYYLSAPKSTSSKYKRNLYHKDKNCPEYQLFLEANYNMVPKFVTSKEQAASIQAIIERPSAMGGNEKIEGFYPCPICNP